MQPGRMKPPLINARISELFERQPLLVAFSLDEDLANAEVELRGWPGLKWGDEVYREINDEIWALVADAEDEGVYELLRGRTFARTLH